MEKKPRISVIVSARNEADKIEQCLEAIFAQSLKPYEVILVDGNSQDGTVDRARKFPVKIFYQDYNSKAGACQVGVNNAEGDYVAFTDADCIPDAGWLAALTRELVEGVAGVGGRARDIGEGLWTRSINLTLKTPLSGAKSRWTKRRIMKNLGVCGANGICRREDILKAGGFRVTLSGAEDLEMSRRLAKLGVLVYSPEAVVRHDHGRGLREFAKQAYRYGGWRRESRLYDMQVIPPLVAPILMLSLIFTPWIIAGALALYSGAVIVSGITIAVQERKPAYLYSIPLAYAVEHLCYITGFWKEAIRPRKKGIPWK
jgi:glycosyltransferase involved in cell wall biosynthesis